MDSSLQEETSDSSTLERSSFSEGVKDVGGGVCICISRDVSAGEEGLMGIDLESSLFSVLVAGGLVLRFRSIVVMGHYPSPVFLCI